MHLIIQLYNEVDAFNYSIIQWSRRTQLSNYTMNQMHLIIQLYNEVDALNYSIIQWSRCT